MPAADQVLGPYGALILAVALLGLAAKVIQKLWQEHIAADERERADDRDQRDRALGLLDLSLQNNRDAIAAWTKRDATDAARARRTDR